MMSITDKKDPSSPSRTPKASNKNRESGARRAKDLRKERAQQHYEIFKYMALSASDSAKSAESVAIVNILSSYYSFTPLEWDGLASEEKFRFYQIAGTEAGCNVAWTFNISDGQREEWEANPKLDSLSHGFDQKVLRPVKDAFRRKYGKLPTLWYVVEPNEWKRRRGHTYRDTDDKLRRFGAHGAIKLSTFEELQDFEQFLSAKIDKHAGSRKYMIELRPIGGFEGPIVDHLWSTWFLKEAQRPARKQNREISRQSTKYTPVGWYEYATKALPLTTSIHADVCGKRPYGATQDLQSSGKALYDTVRAELHHFPKTLPAGMRDHLEAVVKCLPPPKHLADGESVERAIDYVLFVSRSVPAIADDLGTPLAAAARSLADALGKMAAGLSAGD
tara:strand:+ start:10434 stop:11603 length:1170 start_codon:yes stop_codon:yes gene_type:complete